MEKHNMITALCLVLFIGLTGCGNNFDVSDKYDGVIGLSTPGYSLVEMFDVGVKHTENIYFQRGGLNSTPSIIHIGIDETLVDSINTAKGTAYKLLPAGLYTIDQTAVQTGGEDRLLAGSITVDPAKLRELNGGNYGIVNYVIPLRIATEGMPLVSERSTLVLGFCINEAAVLISNTDDEEIDLESVDALKFPVELPFENQWDITVKAEVDASYVDSYNEMNGTFYSLLPEICYTTNGQVKMARGTSSAEIGFTLNKEEILPGNYILPVKIQTVEADVTMSFNTDVKVFIITKKGKELDRNPWTITYCTTQETVGDPGQAEHLIDNDVSSFWHSRWQGGSDPLPYDIIIDMKKQTAPSQIKMLVRNNSGNQLRLVRFYMGDSFSEIAGTDWKFIGEFSCNVSTNYFTYAVKQSSGRYLRLEIPNAGGNGTVAAICDLKVLGSSQ